MSGAAESVTVKKDKNALGFKVQRLGLISPIIAKEVSRSCNTKTADFGARVTTFADKSYVTPRKKK